MEDPLGSESGLDGGLQFSLAAALAKQYASDAKAFLAMVAGMLESAMPDQTEIGTRGGLFSKRMIVRVAVALGDNLYALEDPGRGSLRAVRTHIVRGIALKSEEIPVPEWIEDLGAALQSQARSNAAAREALSRMVW